MTLLVTGAAGFIGYFATRRFLDRGDEVVGIDNLNNYYDVSLKRARLEQLLQYPRFRFLALDIADRSAIAHLFATEHFRRVVHLAAQAGVRHSLDKPYDYVDSNLTGTLSILEGCRHNPVEHLVFASSSSVYGASTRMPFSVHEAATHPLSLYAATKRAAELMAHSYSTLFQIPTTGLRFFTVYGPWGRPDMALFRFAHAIMQDTAIEVFNHGHHRRDFTYVDDVIEGLVRVTDRTATPDQQWNGADPARSSAPFCLYNIGSNRPIALLRYIEILEECLARKSKMIMKPLQPGDVPETFADVEELVADVGFRPSTPVEIGVRRFAEWFLNYYGYR